MNKKDIFAENYSWTDFSKYLWKEGYKNVVLPLQPTTIIRYGDKMPDEMSDISIYFENSNLKRLRNGR